MKIVILERSSIGADVSVDCIRELGETTVYDNTVTLEEVRERVKDADIVITEIGGTIGDLESQPFIEAVRQISLEAGRGAGKRNYAVLNLLFVVTAVWFVSPIGINFLDVVCMLVYGAVIAVNLWRNFYSREQ